MNSTSDALPTGDSGPFDRTNASPHPGASATGDARSSLTTRERAVVQFLIKGETNKEIARALMISPFTVRGHVQSVARKLGCRNRVEIATWWATHY